jgi:hypothetical protein
VSDRRNTPAPHIPRAFLRPLTGAALGLLAAGSLGVAQAASTICEPDGGYVVAYYNGTFATPEDADAHRAALRISRHGKYTGAAETATTAAGKVEPVRYETFYSTAGTASGATESRFQALAAEYRKLLDGALTQNWEYFWDMASGNTDNWSVLAAKSGDSRFLAITSAFPSTVTSLASKAKTDLDADLKVSTTMAARQLARAQALYTERQKLLMVGYSQGTLFANKAFAKLGSPTDKTVLQQELTALPAAALQSTLTATMASLTIPTPAQNQGFFTATLSWAVPAASIGIDPATGKDYENDFDVHVVEPGLTAGTLGKHVHYTETADKGGAADSLQGNAGFLDKDSVTVGPEHYYASCDETKLLPGVYEITVTQEGTRAPSVSNATLQIAFAKSGEVFSKTWKATELPGYVQRDKLAPVVKIKVDKIASGNWTAALVP